MGFSANGVHAFHAYRAGDDPALDHRPAGASTVFASRPRPCRGGRRRGAAGRCAGMWRGPPRNLRAEPRHRTRAEAKRFGERHLHRREGGREQLGLLDRDRITLGLTRLRVHERDSILCGRAGADDFRPRMAEQGGFCVFLMCFSPLRMADRPDSRAREGPRARSGYQRAGAAQRGLWVLRSARASCFHTRLGLSRLWRRADRGPVRALAVAASDPARCRRFHRRVRSGASTAERGGSCCRSLLARRTEAVGTALEGVAASVSGLCRGAGTRSSGAPRLRLERARIRRDARRRAIGAEVHTALMQTPRLRARAPERRRGASICASRARNDIG